MVLAVSRWRVDGGPVGLHDSDFNGAIAHTQQKYEPK